MDEPKLVKFGLLGKSGVGKASIISQFAINGFNPCCAKTVSVQFISKIIEFQKKRKNNKIRYLR